MRRRSREAAMHLKALDQRLAVCRLETGSDVPAWASHPAAFLSITRTADELSIVCPFEAVPAGVPSEGPWRALRVEGTLVMTLIGILASLANPLAEAGISIFAISTYDTDYVMVHEPDFDAAVAALIEAGHTVS